MKRNMNLAAVRLGFEKTGYYSQSLDPWPGPLSKTNTANSHTFTDAWFGFHCT